MAESDMFLSTSRIEGYPNTFVQAFSYGLPVLSVEVDIDGVISKNNFGAVRGSVEELAAWLRAEIERKDSSLASRDEIKGFARAEYGLSNFDPLLELIRA